MYNKTVGKESAINSRLYKTFSFDTWVKEWVEG